jgi:ABC-type multidrug transport system permease subunit
MVARVFLGTIMILVFIITYPFFISLWTDNTSGFNHMMLSTNMSDMERSIWGLFPLAFLVLGVGGIIWLIVRDKDR